MPQTFLRPAARRRPHRLAALACALPLLLAACGGSGGGSTTAGETPPGELPAETVATSAWYGRADAGVLPAGALVTARAFQGGQPAGGTTASTTEDGLFSILLPGAVDDLHLTAQAPGAGHPSLSAYLPAVGADTPLRLNLVTTLVDRVRQRGALTPADAAARVAAFLGLPTDTPLQDIELDRAQFDPDVFHAALQESGLAADGFLDALATQALAEPAVVRSFALVQPEPAWDDPPLLHSVPFAGDLAAAAAKSALNKLATGDSAIGGVLANLGFGSEAHVRAQLAEINRKLDALATAVEKNGDLIRKSTLETRTTALQPYVGKVRTAQAQLEAIAGYTSAAARAEQARLFNLTVESLLLDERVFARSLLGEGGSASLAQMFIELVWADPTQRFYAWDHQERILEFLDYYDAVNASMYIVFANFYRGKEAEQGDYGEILARLDRQLAADRAAYRKLWPQRLPDKRMFIGKVHQVVYSGVRGYGPADDRITHLTSLHPLEQPMWFMPTTKYYEAQHRITIATGQKVTQWLYRDFLDYAKSQNKSIGEAVVAAGAPAALKGTGKNAIFLLNEDLQQLICARQPVWGTCIPTREHVGYVVFDLAHPTKRGYQVMRPKDRSGNFDPTIRVPGNYHYLYARELSANERALWKVQPFKP